MDSSTLALAQPIAIGNVELRNRILMAPITTNFGDERGYATERTFSFYEERARGGAGALIFEATSTHPQAKMCIREHCLHDDSYIPGLQEVTRRVRAQGARTFVQICHAGPKAPSKINGGAQPVSASAVAVKTADMPRELAREEFPRVIEEFASAAARAREAGFDGVELHACHFYLLSAFLSGYLNRRTDEYGGSVENRVRLVREVIQAVKARAGSDYPVICRVHGREGLANGMNEAEAQEIAWRLAAAGADALHVSAATTPINPKLVDLYAISHGGPPRKETPSGCYVEYAAAIKRVVSIPVIAVGKLNDPAVAERTLREGSADAVAIARGLIVDPDLPAKAMAGCWEEIVPCEDCLTCHTTTQKQQDLGCSVNKRPWIPKVPWAPPARQ